MIKEKTFEDISGEKFLSPVKFCAEIERLVQNNDGVN